MKKTAAWLRHNDLDEVAALFREHEIDGEALLSLTHADLIILGINTIGLRSKLLRLITAVKRKLWSAPAMREKTAGP